MGIYSTKYVTRNAAKQFILDCIDRNEISNEQLEEILFELLKDKKFYNYRIKDDGYDSDFLFEDV